MRRHAGAARRAAATEHVRTEWPPALLTRRSEDAAADEAMEDVDHQFRRQRERGGRYGRARERSRSMDGRRRDQDAARDYDAPRAYYNAPRDCPLGQVIG